MKKLESIEILGRNFAVTDHPQKSIEDEQKRQNLSTKQQWSFYNSHRQSLERLIVPDHHHGKICVFGAGNCNDLDLQWLTSVYQQVHLLDLDLSAIAEAAQRQKVPDPSRIYLHAPVDLTGIADDVARWEKATPDASTISKAIHTVNAGGRSPSTAESFAKNGGFGQPPSDMFSKIAPVDVVLSPCVLTQTINPSRNALRDHYAPSDPICVRLRNALIARHLRLMNLLLDAGGKGVLAIDIISQEHFGELARVPEDELPSLFAKYISMGKHYPGLDPDSLNRLAANDPELSKSISPIAVQGIWRWHLGLNKCFVVCGLVFEKLRR